MDYLTVEAVTLRQLLSGRYSFELPWFQRAYAWTDIQAGRLLHDLVAAMDDRPYYPLGRIWIADPTGNGGKVSLIDGHQRLITLTMLFALLRDHVSDRQAKAEADGAIASRNGSSTTKRFTPQPNIAAFFEAVVQEPAGSDTEPSGDIMQLASSELNILANRNHLRARLAETLPDQAAKVALIRYLLDRCLVVVHAVADEDDAWTIVSTEEETSLAFHPSERSKVTLISGMPRQEQEVAGRIFERCQGLVGADDMTRLLSHIRSIDLRRRSVKPVEKDLMQRFELDKHGLAFLENELKPRSELMARIKRKALAEGGPGDRQRPRLEALSWLDNQYWMPPLLHWLSRNGPGSPATVDFIERIDRLAWVQKLATVDPTDQEQRFLRVLADIDRNLAPERMPQLEIEPKLKAQLLENLRSNTFYAKRFSGLVMRRICFNLDPGSDRGPVDGDRVTMEHVLPRRPKPDSGWWRDFSGPELIAQNVNRLGNLVLLSLADNHAAGRNEWPDKRQIMAGSGFVMSTEAARQHTTWNAKTIEQRTEALIAVLLKPWNLSPAR